MAKPQHILIFRFSSLGDVAMTVPVIKLLLQQHPQLQVTMVSTAFVKPLFDDIERLQFHTADLKGKHKGVGGLYKLYKELKTNYQFDAIADLHNVLRTKILKIFFSFSRKRFAAIDKGRKEKKELTRQHHKILRPLKSTFQRYADVFALLGFPLQMDIEKGVKQKSSWALFQNTDFILVGISPFALHEEKNYPAGKMKEVIRLLRQHENIHVYLFGSQKEAVVLNKWKETSIESVAGIMDFPRQLELISQLDIMVCMDSANMHLASLYGVPVVSIWGGNASLFRFLWLGTKSRKCSAG